MSDVHATCPVGACGGKLEEVRSEGGVLLGAQCARCHRTESVARKRRKCARCGCRSGHGLGCPKRHDPAEKKAKKRKRVATLLEAMEAASKGAAELDRGASSDLPEFAKVWQKLDSFEQQAIVQTLKRLMTTALLRNA